MSGYYIRFFLLGWVFVLGCPSLIFSQRNDVFLHEFAPQKQLADLPIQHIIQSKKGHLWLGTFSGLYRYDGQNVARFNHDPKDPNSILNNNVTNLIEDAYQQLWIVGESGISCYNPKTDKFYTWFKINARQFHNFPNTGILMLDRQGQKVSLIQPKRDQRGEIVISSWLEAHQLGGKKGLRINTLKVDKWDRIWIGTNQGIWRYDPDTQTVFLLSSSPVDALCTNAKNDQIWVGTSGPSIEQYLIEPKSDELKLLQRIDLNTDKRIKILDLLVDQENNAWVATNKGLYKAACSDRMCKDYKIDFIKADEERKGALTHDHVLCLYIDQSQNLWVGTRQGMGQLRKQAFEIEPIKLNPPKYVPLNQVISTVFEDPKGNLWVGMPNDGLFVRKSGETQFQKVPIKGNLCQDIVLTSQGNLLVSIDRSCWLLNDISNIQKALEPQNWQEIYRGDQPVKALLETKAGTIWLGCWKKGIEVLSLDDFSVSPSPIKQRQDQYLEFHVEVLYKDRKGNIWVGTRGYGLYQLDPQGKLLYFSNLEAKEGEISYGILDIKEDSRGRIWIGTRGGGLLRITPNQEAYERYTVEQGLPSNTVSGIAEDNFGRIWASTQNGLALNLIEEPIPFIKFGVEDGILNPLFNFHSVAKSNEGSIYFGSNNGLYHIKPKSLAFTPQNPKLDITQLLILDKQDSLQQNVQHKITLTDTFTNVPVVLAHDQNSFEVRYTALDFTIPSKIKFAYRLKGFEKKWHYQSSGERFVRYSDIPAGNYEFELMSSDNHGLWSRQTVLLPIQISASFWASKEASLLYWGLFILFGVLSVWLVFRWKKLRVRLSRVTQDKARQETNITYFSDLSHEIRNRLTLIMGPLEKVMMDQDTDVQLDTVQKIYRNAVHLKRLTDEIMNLRKSEMGAFKLSAGRGDVVQVLQRLKSNMDDIAGNKGIAYHFETTQAQIIAWFDQQLLEIIALNLIGNAFKFTPTSGTINIRLGIVFLEAEELSSWNLSTGEYIHCEIENTGEGISKEDIERIFDPFYQTKVSQKAGAHGSGLGLNLVTRLVSLHHGAIKAESKPQQSTIISFWLPRQKDAYQDWELQMEGFSGPSLSPMSEVVKEPKQSTTLATNKPLILIVDDDIELRQMLRDILSHEFNTLVARNGQQGYELALKHKPALIISDLMMPDTDGLYFLQKVRSDEKIDDTPFIILTAQNSESQRLASIQQDANDYIEKPFQIEFLRWRIKNLIQSQRVLKEKYQKVITAEPLSIALNSAGDQFIQGVVELLEQHLADTWLSVEFLASEMNMSRATFYRRMEEIMQDSPSGFIRRFRLKRAVDLLKQQKLNISEIAYKTGFKSPRYFSKCFQKEYGLVPSAYLKSLEEADHGETMP